MSREHCKVGDVYDLGPIDLLAEVTSTGAVYTMKAAGLEVQGARISHTLRQLADRMEMESAQDNPIGEMTVTGSLPSPSNFDPVTGTPLENDVGAVCATPHELFEKFKRSSNTSFESLNSVEKLTAQAYLPELLGAVHACLRMMVQEKVEAVGDSDVDVTGPTPKMLPILVELTRRMNRSDPATVRTYARSFVDDITSMVAHKLPKGSSC
jgi:hypothetical protein